MPTGLLGHTDVDLSTSRRSLLLVWQNPNSRRFIKIGRLDLLVDGRFVFHYLSDAVEDPEFRMLDDFPKRDTFYVSNSLPSFFANRVMSSHRSNYRQYLHWLGVDDLASVEVPIEILARTGGGRVTDTFHLVERPEASATQFTSRFFVSGVRHAPGIEARLEALGRDSALSLSLEEANVKNPRAVVVLADQRYKIGYVPDWLCSDIYGLIKNNWQLSAVAERVNPDAPAHIRVLCRITAVQP